MTDTKHRSNTQPVRVLFVCLGNICRSPMAEGVFRALAAKRGLDVEVDSAGTGAWHVGEPPDGRGQQAALRRGIDLSSLRGRQVSAGDFEHFDLILAMDDGNLVDLRQMVSGSARERARLFLEFAPECGRREVPDPYYGGDGGFDDVLDLIEAASDGLADHLMQLSARMNAKG